MRGIQGVDLTFVILLIVKQVPSLLTLVILLIVKQVLSLNYCIVCILLDGLHTCQAILGSDHKIMIVRP